MEGVSSTPSKKRKGSTSILEDEQITVKMDPYYLHCSICTDPLDREADHHLFQCTNGHVMCTPCASKVGDTCPDCLTAAVNRCIVLENIVDGIRKPCSFSPHGCSEFVSQAEKPAHEARCSHAPLRCLVPGCAWAGTDDLIADHIRIDHGRLCGVQYFNYNKVFAVRLKRQEALHLLKGKDGSVFALLTRSAAASGVAVGSTICLVCVRRGLGGAAIYEYDLEVRRGRSSVTLKSVPEEWKRYSSSSSSASAAGRLEAADEFLFVPQPFAGGSTLEVEVVQLQAELSTERSQLINSRLAAAGAWQYSALPHQLISMQPAYSNSSVSNTITLSRFPTSGLDQFCDAPSSELRRPSQKQQDEREEMEEGQSPADFSSENFHPN